MKLIQKSVVINNPHEVDSVIQQYNKEHFICVSITPILKSEYSGGLLTTVTKGFLVLFNSTEL